MNKLKKLAGIILAVCLMVPCLAGTVFAADGTLMFSDPSAKAGEEVEVTVRLRAEDAIGDGHITVTYDAAMLEFVSGNHATGSGGKVQLENTGNGTVTELTYSMKFKALAQGVTTINVESCTAYLYNDEKLNPTLGNSTVTIAEGETAPVTAPQPTAAGAPKVELNGKNYTVDSSLAGAMIPEGFIQTTMTYEGQEITVLLQEASGQYLMYLRGEDGNTTTFCLYNTEDGTVSDTEQIEINAKSYILVTQFSGSKLPDNYQKTELEINGKVFPTWQDPQNPDYYLVYALSSNGHKSYYQYDKSEETYQRYVTQQSNNSEIAAKTNKLQQFVNEYVVELVVAIWVVFLLMLLIIIVTAVKLKHRNDELDDWYEKYGDDEDDSSAEYIKKELQKQQVPKKAPKKRVLTEDEFDEDDFEDEDNFEDVDEFEDDTEDDDFDDDFDDDYDDLDNDFEEAIRSLDKKKSSGQKETEEFKVDFVDLL